MNTRRTAIGARDLPRNLERFLVGRRPEIDRGGQAGKRRQSLVAALGVLILGAGTSAGVGGRDGFVPVTWEGEGGRSIRSPSESQQRVVTALNAGGAFRCQLLSLPSLTRGISAT